MFERSFTVAERASSRGADMCGIAGEVIQRMFRVHFATGDYAAVTCADCLDYRTGQCEGKGCSGYECFACIEKHATLSHDVTAN